MSIDQSTSLEEILKKWAVAFKENSENDNFGCQHETREYIGFSEQYEFCIKCDAKKMNGKWQADEKSQQVLNLF